MTDPDPEDKRAATGHPDTGVADAVLREGVDGAWELILTGPWTRNHTRPDTAAVLAGIRRASPRTLRLREDHLTAWDSSLLALLRRILLAGNEMGWEMEVSRLRPGIRELLRLATAVPEQEPVSTGRREGVLSWLGRLALEQVSAWWDGVGFLGSVTLACLRALRGRARFRGRDVWLMLGACGPDALPIISLISFLMGLILAFVGAVQLRLFGAEIYVADLVAIGVVRAMGAIMTGIVMAGRSGAAFAAQLGTMEVNEEIDAFRTMGIDPIEFLVLPRLLALTLMMPLLCLYADVMGILGGLAVGVGLMRIGLVQYVVETRRIVGLNDLGVGLFMSVVFGILIALAGCLRGLQSGRSSAAVGQAATRAVVTGIVWIVVATAIITVLCNALGV